MTAMLGSVRVSVKPMPECSPWLLSLQRAVSRLLESTPNYVEVTAVLAIALTARLLFLPAIWKASPQACVAVALFVCILVYACVDRGQLFAYFGWVHPRRRVFWLYALVAGAAAAALVIVILHAEHTLARPNLSGNIALRSHDRTHYRRDTLPRCGVFGHLCDRSIDQGGFSACGSRWRLSSLPCSSRSLTRRRWEFHGLCSSEWARCTRSCAGDPIQPPPRLSCTVCTTQSLRSRCCIVERSDWGHRRLSTSHALHIAKQ